MIALLLRENRLRGPFRLEVHSNGEISVRVCSIHGNCAFSLAAQDQSSAGRSHQVVLKYLGAAGWEISDGTTTFFDRSISVEN